MDVTQYLGVEVFQYRLVRELGQGGFGVVFLAEHIHLRRRAACKILFPEFVRRRELVERFFREAQTVCSIGHPAIVDIQNVGHLGSGEPFYLMEYCDGETLADHVARRGGLFARDILDIFGPVADALSVAHQKGIIHRDLKPENIMMAERNGRIGTVKLLDFGIAKLLDSRDGSASRTGISLGTPRYMAPEQALDAKNVDRRADVYGMGATMFYALTGRAVFERASVVETVMAVLQESAPRLSALVPAVPPALDDFIRRCLAKNPAERPDSVAAAWGEIQAILEPLAGRPEHSMVPAPARDMGSRSFPTQAPAGAGASTLSAHGIGIRPADAAAHGGTLRKRWILAFASLGAIVLLIALMAGNEPTTEPDGRLSGAVATEPGADARPGLDASADGRDRAAVPLVSDASVDGSDAEAASVMDGIRDAGIEEPSVEDPPQERPECQARYLVQEVESARSDRKRLAELTQQVAKCRTDGILEPDAARSLSDHIAELTERIPTNTGCSAAGFRRIAQTGNRNQRLSALRRLRRKCRPRLPQDVYRELSRLLYAE